MFLVALFWLFWDEYPLSLNKPALSVAEGTRGHVLFSNETSHQHSQLKLNTVELLVPADFLTNGQTEYEFII